MKALIIEDEYPAAERLAQLVHALDAEIEILAKLDSVKSALEWFQSQTHLDLIFSDIQLSDGLSFEIFETMHIEAPIIFTTAYDEYAIKAFKVKSIDYLLKPVKQDELAKALEKYKRMIPVTSVQNQLIQVREAGLIAQQKEYKERFLVKHREEFVSIPVGEIAYFYTVYENIYMFTTGNKKYVLEYTLEELEKLLNPGCFFRLNRQVLAHIQSITGIHAHFNGKLKIQLAPTTQEDIYVSREKAKAFRLWMGE